MYEINEDIITAENDFIREEREDGIKWSHTPVNPDEVEISYCLDKKYVLDGINANISGDEKEVSVNIKSESFMLFVRMKVGAERYYYRDRFNFDDYFENDYIGNVADLEYSIKHLRKKLLAKCFCPRCFLPNFDENDIEFIDIPSGTCITCSRSCGKYYFCHNGTPCKEMRIFINDVFQESKPLPCDCTCSKETVLMACALCNDEDKPQAEWKHNPECHECIRSTKRERKYYKNRK